MAGERTGLGSSLLLTGTVHVVHPFHVESNGTTRRHIPDKLDNVRGIPQALQVNAGTVRPLSYSIFVPTLPTTQFIKRPPDTHSNSTRNSSMYHFTCTPYQLRCPVFLSSLRNVGSLICTTGSRQGILKHSPNQRTLSVSRSNIRTATC